MVEDFCVEGTGVHERRSITLIEARLGKPHLFFPNLLFQSVPAAAKYIDAGFDIRDRLGHSVEITGLKRLASPSSLDLGEERTLQIIRLVPSGFDLKLRCGHKSILFSDPLGDVIESDGHDACPRKGREKQKKQKKRFTFHRLIQVSESR